jgi:acetyl-CoA carboxylase biotin carboxyl carrier protein
VARESASKEAGGGRSVLTVQEIKQLIEWVAANRIRGLEVERSGFRLKIEGIPSAGDAPGRQFAGSVPGAHAPVVSYPVPAAMPVPVPVAPSSEPAASPAAPASSAPVAATTMPVDENAGLHVIPSPIVGTFYRAPAPDRPPFAKLGDRVTAGQTLCIVEAMKLMNEIEADISGEVVKIFAQNAQPVEYGEKLFAIRPD